MRLIEERKKLLETKNSKENEDESNESSDNIERADDNRSNVGGTGSRRDRQRSRDMQLDMTAPVKLNKENNADADLLNDDKAEDTKTETNLQDGQHEFAADKCDEDGEANEEAEFLKKTIPAHNSASNIRLMSTCTLNE